MSKNNIEGILLNKIPFKEKNIIGHVLLRNGHKLSVVFYGGQGGGKKHVGSTLQLGYLMSFSLTGRTKSHFEMLGSSEYKEKWYHSHITNNVKAFYLLCFFNECLEKFAPLATTPYDLEKESDEQVGLFRLLSNAIFRLEKMCRENSYRTELELGIFLIKAMVELGVFPNVNICELSGESLSEDDKAFLSPEKGGFTLYNFLEPHEKKMVDDSSQSTQGLHFKLGEVATHKYSELEDIEFSLSECKQLFSFICYQLNMTQNEFKTYTSLS